MSVSSFSSLARCTAKYSPQRFVFLLYEFGFAFFKFLFAYYATEMVGFAFIRDFILSRVFI